MTYKYIGDGKIFLPGVPARDLTDEEWERLTPEQKAAARNSRVYRHQKPQKPKKNTPKE